MEDGFNTEAADQKNRLSAIGLYKTEPDKPTCPLCEHELSGEFPKADAIRNSLANLERQMEPRNGNDLASTPLSPSGKLNWPI